MLQPKYLSRTVSKIMSDKRDAERVESAFSGIVLEDGQFVCHCIIRDVSISGMKIEMPDKVKIPDRIEMKTPAMTEVLHLKTAWRSGNKAGVEFVIEKMRDEQPEQEEDFPEKGAA